MSNKSVELLVKKITCVCALQKKYLPKYSPSTVNNVGIPGRTEDILVQPQKVTLNAFNVSTFVPVIMGTAITRHSLLTLLKVNVSSIPLQIYVTPLTSDATVASGGRSFRSSNGEGLRYS